MLRKDAERRRRAWSIVLEGIARKVGEGSPLYMAMGPVAWGRYEGEPSASDSKDNTLFGYAYLRGMRDALLRAAEIAGWDGLADLRNAYNEVDNRIRSDNGGA